MRFPIVIHKDPDSDFGVIVPDLPGCFSAGDSPEDAIDQAREAIGCHLEGLLMDGEPVPSRRPLAEHQADPAYAGGVWALVEVDLAKLGSKTTRVNITLPERVLALVDAAAAREGESRSGFLARAALAAMDERRA